MKIFKRFDKFIFRKLRRQYIKILEKELENCNSFLDIGCGEHSPIINTKLNFDYSVGIDGFGSSLDKIRITGVYHEYFKLDINNLKEHFNMKTFDCVAAFDVIEHFNKEEGLKLIEIMKTIAKKKIILFTPNGFLPQEPFDGNIYQEHLSGWNDKEMIKMGFRVYGINGWYILRKQEKTKIRWKPVWFWGRVSLLTQLFTRKKTKFAFQILCIYDL